MTTATTKLCALIGSPVAHSRSPALHGAAIAALGLDAAYLAFDVAPDALGDTVRGLRALGAVGFNVTLPHKRAVMAHLDEVTPEAAAIGAVNTVTRRGARLVGSNTDAPGLVRALEEAGVALEGRRAVVLGAGGAARAAAVGLAGAGVAVTVAARRPERAAELCGETGVGRGVALDAAPLRDVDLLVQATSATLDDGPAAEAFADALPLDALPAHAAVIDLVYAPRETTVLRAAAARGLRTVDGLGMLAWQAALAFAGWFDVDPPSAAMRAAIEAP